MSYRSLLSRLQSDSRSMHMHAASKEQEEQAFQRLT